MMKKYRRSVVIFDLDSISGIHKEYSTFDEIVPSACNEAFKSISFSYQKRKPNAMAVALNIGLNLTPQDNLWVFYVSRERKIINELKQSLHFPETPSEKAFASMNQ
jgi:hypothetical protein